MHRLHENRAGFRLAGMLALAVALSSCKSTETHFTSSWKPGDAQPVSAGAGQHVAAVFINENTSVRHEGEDYLAQELAKYGALVVPSYRMLPDRPSDESQARQAMKQSGIDAVVSMRVVSVDPVVSYTPGYWTSSGIYSGLWGYWGYGWNSVYAPGYLSTENRVGIETLVYSTTDNRLLWAGMSETFTPKSVRSAVHSAVRKAVKKMHEEQVLVP